MPVQHDVFVCLMNNKRKLSETCREVMGRQSPPDARYSGRRSHAEATDLDENQ
jgi:hypothetical protein